MTGLSSADVPNKGCPQHCDLTTALCRVLGVLLMMGRYNRRWLQVGPPPVSRPSQGFCCRMSRENSKNTTLHMLKTIVFN